MALEEPLSLYTLLNRSNDLLQNYENLLVNVNTQQEEINNIYDNGFESLGEITASATSLDSNASASVGVTSEKKKINFHFGIPKGENGITPSYQGEYSSSNAYNYFDWVTYEGNSYICINVSGAAAGTAVTDETYWACLAQKGGIGTVGELKYFAGTTVPEHCLLCDGSAISRTAYPELFAAIGTTYGSGNGSTTFNLPNASGVIYGQVGRTVGASVSAGLPNIQGYFSGRPATRYFEDNTTPLYSVFWSSTSGPFSYSSSFSSESSLGAVIALATSDAFEYTQFKVARRISFNAANYNSIYGNATTVQPAGIVANICIVYEWE